MFIKNLLKKILSFLPFICASISALAWFCILWTNRNLSPYADDYGGVLAFLIEWKNTHSLQLIFSVHNEHSQLILRIITLLMYSFTNHISFSWLTFCSLLTAPILATLIFYYFKIENSFSTKEAYFWLLPVFLLIFQPGSWENYLWITCGLTHAVLPICIVLTSLTLQRKAYISAYVILAVSFFTSGGGIFIPGIFLFTNLIKKNKLAAVTGTACYFLAITILISQNDLLKSGMSKSEISSNILVLFQYALSFFGDFGHWHSTQFSMVVGAVLLLTYYFLFFHNKSYFLAEIPLFVFLCACSSAILRLSDGGLEHSLLSRYQTLPIVAAISVYIMSLKKEELRIYVWFLGLFLSIFISFRNFYYLPSRISQFYLVENLKSVISRFDPHIILGRYPPREAEDNVLDQAKNLNIYKLGDSPEYFNKLVNSQVPDFISEGIESSFTHIGEDNEYWAASGSAQLQNSFSPDKVCLLVQGSKNIGQFLMCFPVSKNKDSSKVNFIMVLPKKFAFSGSNHLGLMLKGEKMWHLQWLTDLEVK